MEFKPGDKVMLDPCNNYLIKNRILDAGWGYSWGTLYTVSKKRSLHMDCVFVNETKKDIHETYLTPYSETLSLILTKKED